MGKGLSRINLGHGAGGDLRVCTHVPQGPCELTWGVPPQGWVNRPGLNHPREDLSIYKCGGYPTSMHRTGPRSPRRIKPTWGHHTQCCPHSPGTRERINLPGCTQGFALNVSNLVNEVGFPTGRGCFCTQPWWDCCWRNGTVSPSLSLSPGAAGRGHTWELPSHSQLPLTSVLPAGLQVQPPPMAWREEGRMGPASLLVPSTLAPRQQLFLQDHGLFLAQFPKETELM